MATVNTVLIDQKPRDLAANDLRQCYCVEAAAGTGKTTLLVSRLLSIVCSGMAELRQIAAITFTEKAAAELKIRLREKLEEHRRTAAQPVRKYCENALEQLDRASISTIHSFAASLLRERPVEAGVDPGFEQLDQMGSELLFDEVWQKWKEQQLESAPPILRRLLSLEIRLDSEIKTLAAKLLENRDIALLDTPLPAAPVVDEIWREVVDRIRKLRELLRQCGSEEDRGYLQIQQLIATVEQTPPDEFDRERAILLDLKVNPNAGAQANWPKDVNKQQKAICTDLKKIITSAPERIGPGLASEVLTWLKQFLKMVDHEKRARGQLDFQDLLLKARGMVRDNKDVRAYFQGRIKFLLVDEFQDTDPLQAELVFFLAENGAQANNWEQVQLAPGKLFLVGDPKQSIYRFRRADIQIYERAKAIIRKTSDPLVIQQNFRSSPAVLETVNQLFEPQMIPGKYQATYVTLFPDPQRSNPGPGMTLLFASDNYEPGRMDQYHSAEAGLISRFLHQLCGDNSLPIKVWDKELKQKRSATYRDVAILFPVTTGLEFYEDALRAASVPYQLDAGRQFYARRETRALISVLNAVDNPEDSIAVVAALRSPFFGLSDEDLFLYSQGGGQFHYLRRSLFEFPRVTESLQQLRRWHNSRATSQLNQIVNGVLNDSCSLQFFVLLPNGEQAVANLLRIVELARRFESKPGASLRSFVQWLEQREASELAESEAVLADEQEDAVRMLTIHAAKGLEFPIVVLANMACNRRRPESFFIDHNDREIGTAINCGGHKLPSASFSRMQTAEQERSAAEDLRLLYVAATRAKDCLVFPRLAPNKTERARFMELFDQHLAQFGDKPKQCVRVNEVLLVPAEDLPELKETAAVLRRNIGQCQLPPDATAVVLEERKAWRDELSKLDISPMTTSDTALDRQVRRGQADWHSGARAKALGTAFHRIMQQVQLEKEPLLGEIIQSVAAAADILGDASLLREWVTRALASPMWVRACRSDKIWRELPFCVSLNGKLTEGYIDLMFAENGGLVLVDYKTDDITFSQLQSAVDAHREQLSSYREAVRMLTGKEPSEMVLYFARLGAAKSVIAEQDLVSDQCTSKVKTNI